MALQNRSSTAIIVCPGVRENITASPEQRIAVSCIEYGAESSIKGLLLGDSPIIGKTLSALMTILATRVQIWLLYTSLSPINE